MTREDVIKAMAFPIWETWMVNDGLGYNATREEFDDRYLQWVEAESGMKGRLKMSYAVRDAEAVLSALESLGIALVPVDALEPFAAIAADSGLSDHPDSYAPRPARGRPNMGDFRRVAAALSASPLRKTEGGEE